MASILLNEIGDPDCCDHCNRHSPVNSVHNKCCGALICVSCKLLGISIRSRVCKVCGGECCDACSWECSTLHEWRNQMLARTLSVPALKNQLYSWFLTEGTVNSGLLFIPETQVLLQTSYQRPRSWEQWLHIDWCQDFQGYNKVPLPGIRIRCPKTCLPTTP